MRKPATTAVPALLGGAAAAHAAVNLRVVPVAASGPLLEHLPAAAESLGGIGGTGGVGAVGGGPHRWSAGAARSRIAELRKREAVQACGTTTRKR